MFHKCINVLNTRKELKRKPKTIIRKRQNSIKY